MRTALAMIFFIFFVGVDGWYFNEGKLGAVVAVSFFVAITMFSFAIYLIAQVQEISIAGSILKLREVRKDADDAIRDLQASRLAMFSLLLETTKKLTGRSSFARETPEDERLKNFWFLYDKIESAGLVNELKNNIADCTQLYMRAQISWLRHYSNIDVNRQYSPTELAIEAVKPENLSLGNNKTAEESRQNALIAVDHYRKLYELWKKVKQEKAPN